MVLGEGDSVWMAGGRRWARPDEPDDASVKRNSLGK